MGPTAIFLSFLHLFHLVSVSSHWLRAEHPPFILLCCFTSAGWVTGGAGWSPGGNKGWLSAWDRGQQDSHHRYSCPWPSDTSVITWAGPHCNRHTAGGRSASTRWCCAKGGLAEDLLFHFQSLKHDKLKNEQVLLCLTKFYFIFLLMTIMDF